MSVCRKAPRPARRLPGLGLRRRLHLFLDTLALPREGLRTAPATCPLQRWARWSALSSGRGWGRLSSVLGRRAGVLSLLGTMSGRVLLFCRSHEGVRAGSFPTTWPVLLIQKLRLRGGQALAQGHTDGQKLGRTQTRPVRTQVPSLRSSLKYSLSVHCTHITLLIHSTGGAPRLASW